MERGKSGPSSEKPERTGAATGSRRCDWRSSPAVESSVQMSERSATGRSVCGERERSEQVPGRRALSLKSVAPGLCGRPLRRGTSVSDAAGRCDKVSPGEPPRGGRETPARACAVVRPLIHRQIYVHTVRQCPCTSIRTAGRASRRSRSNEVVQGSRSAPGTHDCLRWPAHACPPPVAPCPESRSLLLSPFETLISPRPKLRSPFLPCVRRDRAGRTGSASERAASERCTGVAVW